jgi:hypothetical protein
MQIRTADAAGQGFDQDLAFCGYWHSHVIDDDLGVAHDGCFHILILCL